MKVLAGLLMLAIIWAVGLLAFAARVDQSTPPPAPPVSDGVVALTGHGAPRLEAATRLLEQGKARRLLVSGVNRKASRRDILGVTGAMKPIYDCCVDLGFQAENTSGNAVETAQWVKAKGYHSLIVVTADYHLPRAMLELKGAMPQETLIAYPVRTEDLSGRAWMKNGLAFRRMALEYCKYLAILAREGFLSLGPRDKTAAAADPAPTPAPTASPAATPKAEEP
jgi:uncharacterized SAM-binding protein YcdF (DUF218 family)